ncbi:MAG: Cna B-type domain-containing protein, partial [Lachnospiraceae bacterium]|nr:Cna B-type domain-containing protein [Lachnospiraceae bacterium]
TNAPDINKAGTLSADQKTATWTITVDLGKFYAEGKSLADMLEYVQDTPGTGFSNANIPANLDLNQFVSQGNGVYTYTYQTTVTDDVLTSGSNLALKNDVKMQLKDKPDYVYTDVGTVDLVGKSWVTKTARAQKDENGYIIWDVTLNPIPSGVTDVVVWDELWDGNNHAYVEGVYVDNTMVRTAAGKNYVTSGTYTDAATGILVDSWGNPVVAGTACQDGMGIRLANSYIQGKTSIVITYKTKVTQPTIREFFNQVTVDYKCPVIGSTNHKASATFKDNSNQMFLEKQAEQGNNPYSVNYKVLVDFTKYTGLVEGDVITVEDILPAGLSWDKSTLTAKAGWGYNAYQAVSCVPTESTTADGKTKISFVLTLSADNAFLLNDISSGGGKASVLIQFGTQMTEQEKQKLFEAGKLTYTNEAAASLNGLTATATAPIDITTPPVVDKYGTYNKNTAPDCNYVIEINKECLDLVEGDTLMGVDTLGDLVTYKNGTVEVRKMTPSGWSDPLEQGKDYRFTYSERDGEKKLTFLGLPDATHLKISYTARLELISGTFQGNEGGNTFTLQGTKNSSYSQDYTAMTTAVQSSGWAESTNYDINLNKYWTDGSGQMQPLNGAKFKVVKVSVDETTGLLIDGETVHANVEIEEEGKAVIDKLTLHNIYALYETEAPAGYVLKTEPYYFVLQDSSADLSKVDSSIKVHRFTDGSTIWYENERAYGELELQKTISGMVAGDAIDASKISFTITPQVGEQETYLLSEFTKNGEVYSKLLENVPVGEYKVVETRKDITGYNFEKMEYTVSVAGTQQSSGSEAAGTTGTQIAATVEKGKTTIVALENTYAQKLIDISGSKTWVDNGAENRPGSITINLLENETEIKEQIVTAADDWKWSFEDLPEYKAGEKINYTITEDTVAGYDSEVKGYNVTNTLTPFSISGSKTWVDNDNPYNTRPGSIKINLLADDVLVKSQDIKAEDGWAWSFTNIPEYKNGVKIIYTITEDAVAGYTSSVDGYNVTNTLITTDVSGIKTWTDNNNVDKNRPDSITINLLADGKLVESQNVTSANGWKWSFADLPKYAKDGKEIIYSITENPVTGYESSVNGFDVTNTLKTITVSGSKIWKDGDNQNDTRPESITINLLADGTKIESQKVTAANDWKWSFTELPEYKEGKKVTYTITEDAVAGYTGSVDGDEVTNTLITTSVSGSKTWVDNGEATRPESITINLLADGKQVKSQTVTSANDWKWSFTDLPKYTKTGKEIDYTITEDKVNGYESTIENYDVTNTLITTSVSGSKTWVDNDNQDGLRPESITINLLAGGKEIDEKTVTATNNWTWTFDNLPKYAADGSEIIYTITEDVVKGYEGSVDGYNVTNKHTPETVIISGFKTWDDNDNELGNRPASITVNLLANGEQVASKEVKATDGWKWEFTGMDKYANGKEITYTITEKGITDYTTTISGYNITNSYTPGKTSVTVTKSWEDADNQDGIRPSSVQVQLLADGVAYDSPVTLNEANKWKYIWPDLNQKKAGKDIQYTVKELDVEGYEPVISGNAKDGFKITNTHTPETITVSGSKTWDDADNQDGKRPASITVNLLANGKQIASKKVTASNGWKWTFSDLDKYANGKEIVYTITENDVVDYIPTVDGYNITNKYTPGKTSVTVNKSWSDSNNQDGIRPSSVQVQLLADGVASDEIATLSASNQWSYTWDSLDQMKAGKVIVYTVEEINVPDGYTPSITGSAQGGFVITNSHTPATLTVSGSKTWSDNDNQSGNRPETITVHLLADGVEKHQKVVGDSDNWKWTFKDLPKYEKGKEITYTITESISADYTPVITGFDIENKYTPGMTFVTVNKVWSDNNNQDGIRPDSVQVQLLADGVAVEKAVTLNADNKWSYTWTGLEQKKDGKAIQYTVEEVSVPDGYTPEIIGTAQDGYTIINNHKTETLTVSGVKNWVDDNNKAGKRPASITIHLYANGTEIDSKVVTADDSWAWKFTNLDKYADGKVIQYTIKEDAVEGYTGAVNGYNVTNTYKVEEPQPSQSPDAPEPSQSPAAPEPSQSPAAPEPSQSPDVPEPSQSPAAPEPSQSPDVPEPSQSPDVPEPSQSPDAPEPSQSPDAPEPTQSPDSPQATDDPKPTQTPSGSQPTNTPQATATPGSSGGGSSTTTPAPDVLGNATTPAPTSVPTVEIEVTIPKTADEAPVAVWLVLMMLSLGGMITVGVCVLKRRNNR